MFVLRVQLFVNFFLFSTFVAAQEVSNEKKLIQHIEGVYDKIGKYGRPLVLYNDTFRLIFTLRLVKVVDLDEETNVLTTITWAEHKWRDPFLKWEPSDYGGIQSIRVPASLIWNPDFILYYNLDKRSIVWDQQGTAGIKSDGTVTWIPPNLYKSQCPDQFDSTNFPYDEPQCRLKFGSWSWEANKFDPSFSNDKADISISPYLKSHRWDLVSHWANKSSTYYNCCPDAPFAELTYTIKLRRANIAFYERVLICPAVLLLVLTAAPFLLPASSKAKVSFGAAVFVGFFLYAFVMFDLLGQAAKNAASGKAPKIVCCFCVGIFLSSMSTFLSAIVGDMYYCCHPAPPFLKKIFVDILGPICTCMCLRKLKMKKPAPPPASAEAEGVEDAGTKAEVASGDQAETAFIDAVETTDTACAKSRESAKKCCLKALTEWQIIAIVFNRLFLIIFLVLAIAAICVHMPCPFR